MTQQHRVGATATHIGVDSNGNTYVQYHATRVVKWNPAQIILDSGGWSTTTTRSRMNQTSNQFELGFQVSQKNFDWFVNFKGQILPFTDGMIINRQEES